VVVLIVATLPAVTPHPGAPPHDTP
jgi:hypothetical protein